jgi:hypothetical protein
MEVSVTTCAAPIWPLHVSFLWGLRMKGPVMPGKYAWGHCELMFRGRESAWLVAAYVSAVAGPLHLAGLAEAYVSAVAGPLHLAGLEHMYQL